MGAADAGRHHVQPDQAVDLYAATLNVQLSRKSNSTPWLVRNSRFVSSMFWMCASCVSLPSDRSPERVRDAFLRALAADDVRFFQEALNLAVRRNWREDRLPDRPEVVPEEWANERWHAGAWPLPWGAANVIAAARKNHPPMRSSFRTVDEGGSAPGPRRFSAGRLWKARRNFEVGRSNQERLTRGSVVNCGGPAVSWSRDAPGEEETPPDEV